MMGSVEKMGNYNLKQEVTDKYSLRGRVFSKLRADILSGKYKDHEELKEVAIGEELGVSRTPVREAFRQLHFRYMFRRPSRAKPFQQRADHINILYIFCRDSRYICAFIGNDLNQTF